MSSPIAIVTGANRGIGFEVTRQLATRGYHVIMVARDARRGAEALNRLQDEGLDVELRRADVTNSEEVKSLAEFVRKHHKGVDVLVNNAGILPESSKDTTGRFPSNPLLIPPTSIVEILNVNTLGPLRMIQAFALLLKENARVVNVSSSMGQLSGEWGSGHLGYRMSKTALNDITRMFAIVLATKNIKVNSVDPGWVNTHMGGGNANRTAAEGAASIVWAAELPPDGPSGGFFRDGQRLDW